MFPAGTQTFPGQEVKDNSEEGKGAGERLGQHLDKHIKKTRLKCTHNVLADVADGLQRGLLHVLGAVLVCDIGDQLGDELGPLVHGDLGAGDSGHALGRRAGPVRLCAQRLQNLPETTTPHPSTSATRQTATSLPPKSSLGVSPNAPHNKAVCSFCFLFFCFSLYF